MASVALEQGCVEAVCLPLRKRLNLGHHSVHSMKR
jgi:hypothetical protein